MSGARLNGLETTIQKTHQWLNEIMAALGAPDEHLAYSALRAVPPPFVIQTTNEHRKLCSELFRGIPLCVS